MRFLDGTSISFPGLGIGEFDPIDGFSVFGFEIKFYAIIIAMGLLLAVLYCSWRAKEFGLTFDNILDIALVGVPCAIVGARLYYVILYGTPFSDWLRIRDGGLAIYGGVIGAVLGVGIFSLTRKDRRKRFLPSADVAGIGLLIGQSVGRWGNFFNREAFGGYCDNFLAMRLADGKRYDFLTGIEELRQKAVEGGYEGFIQVHPTFLYESLWNLLGIVLLHYLSKKRKFDGQVFLYYLAWYGLGRMFIEGMRTDSLMSGSIRFSQLLAGLSLLASMGLLAYILLCKRPKPEAMLVNQPKEEPKQETEE